MRDELERVRAARSRSTDSVRRRAIRRVQRGGIRGGGVDNQASARGAGAQSIIPRVHSIHGSCPSQPKGQYSVCTMSSYYVVVHCITGYRLPVNFPAGNLGRPETAGRVAGPFRDVCKANE